MNVKEYRRQVEARLAARASVSAAAPVATKPPEQTWKEAIAQLSDSSASAETRIHAIQLLQAGTFLGRQFDPFRADYIAALRAAILDADISLRHSALDVLVDFGDEFARQKLTESLRGIGAQLLPAAAALGLLARDDHGSASEVARDVFTNSTDVPTRAQAVRVLGSDPTASGFLARIMNDKDEFREVRRAGAVALRNLDPQLFRTKAAEILDDHTDFKDIKATVGGALERAGQALDRFRSARPSDDTK